MINLDSIFNMEILISFYDNALIYYPNVFFAALFFISILGMILVSIGIIVLGGKIRRVIEEIKNDLKQIKIKERKRISIIPMVRVFLTRNKVFFLQVIIVIFIRINTALEYIESRTEKIIKKIGKEILIEE